MSSAAPEPTIKMRDVSVVIDGRLILDHIDWEVAARDRWLVLGPNGCGKTTLLRIASLSLHPTAGEVVVVGGRLGQVDVRSHRRLIGFAGAAVAQSLRDGISVRDAVMTARHAALEAWWHEYDEDDAARAHSLLERFGVGHLAEHRFGNLSSGERQRVLLARSLMAEPKLLLLDEPAAGLDLGGREDLLLALEDLACDVHAPPTVLVTHHVEEIPSGSTHALLIRAGRTVASGPLHSTLSSESLSDCFGTELDLSFVDGRWSVRARRR